MAQKTRKPSRGKARKPAKGLTYADAGVHFETHNALVGHIFTKIRATSGPRVMDVEDGFGGLFNLENSKTFGRNWRKPVLVACTDGVGTKLKLAFEMGKHDTVGIDCVAMSVNDMLCMGAEPLFFLDYIATGKKDLKVLLPLVGGVAEGCKQAGCALLGGETAEMPGFYPDGEYDIAGFAVGAVEKARVMTGAAIRKGDVVLGLESSGLHSNGFSLVRKIVARKRWKLGQRVAEFGRSLGLELLEPTRIYVSAVRELLQSGKPLLTGLANITGGGFLENIPRILPKGLEAAIEVGSWPVPPVFDVLQNAGKVERDEMHRVFNMGIGMVAITRAANADAVAKAIRKSGVKVHVIGQIRAGGGGVVLL